jgi:hypothetical protein
MRGRRPFWGRGAQAFLVQEGGGSKTAPLPCGRFFLGERFSLGEPWGERFPLGEKVGAGRARGSPVAFERPAGAAASRGAGLVQ